MGFGFDHIDFDSKLVRIMYYSSKISKGFASVIFVFNFFIEFGKIQTVNHVSKECSSLVPVNNVIYCRRLRIDYMIKPRPYILTATL